jgi:spore coat polysaccharide biosynthesis predicted glycosyltransferase SpsG
VNEIRRYVFRVDATFLTGAGHFKRCLTIAYELQSYGLINIFVGNFEIPWILDELKENGIEHCGSEDFKFSSKDILILDKYNLDYKFLDKNNFSKKIQIIDSSTSLIESDLYLHMGPDASFVEPKLANNSKVLWGLKYLATRKFSNSNKLKKNEIIARGLLIVGGGTDTHSFSKSIINSLESIEMQNIEIHIMSDELFYNHKELANNLHFHKLGGDLDKLMSHVDTVITTAGTSSWDFIANKKVVGIALAVDNQIPNFTFQIENEFVLEIGTYNDESGWDISAEAIKSLVFNNELRSKLLKNSASKVDLKGPKRVAAEIIALENSL